MTIIDTGNGAAGAVGEHELPADVHEEAAALGAAVGSAVAIYARPPRGGWRRLGETDGGPDAPNDVDEALADALADEGGVDVSPAGAIGVQHRVTAGLRSAEATAYVATAFAAIDPHDAVHAVATNALRDHRQGRACADLQDENDHFANQMAADLEELSFLRSMVSRLSNVAAADELSGMAQQTLPVLNATVRARCLAFLVVKDRESPFDVRVAHRVGDGDPTDGRLREIIARLGPTARDQTIVRNWDAAGETLSASATDRPEGVRSLVLTPLVSAGELFGWLIAVNRLPPSECGSESSWQLASDEFGSGEATLMATSASILAMHSINLEMLREKEQIVVSIVRSLVSAIEAKDPYTRGHSERVALFTRRLAEEIGFFEPEAQNIYLSGLLHDVGKIGVSDATLAKPDRLTDAEFAEIQKHPDEGWAILCDLEQLRYVLPGVLHHHERWDGKGYPDGLAGEAIPLDGRIMAVADAYDAMTSDRPYRKGMPNEKAEAILREGAGTQWDPDCVDAFFRCLPDIHQIQREYTQRERRQRTCETTSEEG